MIPENEFIQHMGGLYTAVLPFNKADLAYHDLLGNVLRDALRHEARVHGATFDEKGFGRILQGIQSGKIEALFFMAAWDTCKPKVIGMMINFPSVFMERDNGKV
jgi:hypothetical protein